MDHEMKVLANAGDGDIAVVCTCGTWDTTVTEEKFAEPCFKRHLRIQLVPPHNKPNEWE